jgi:hypothetical protein
LLAAVSVTLIALGVASCSSSGGAPTSTPTSDGIIVPTDSPSLDPAAAAVIAQYRAFWRALPQASAATADDARVQALVGVTTDPELSLLVRKLGQQRSQGQQLYGVDQPRPTLQSMTADQAVVRDCQDSSSAGVEKIVDHQRVTVGVARHLVTATLLKRGAVWKVSVVDYAPSGTTC